MALASRKELTTSAGFQPTCGGRTSSPQHGPPPAGGPGTATTTLSWKTYLTTFDSLDFGMGNAYAYTISLITFALALGYFRVLYRKGEFEA